MLFCLLHCSSDSSSIAMAFSALFALLLAGTASANPAYDFLQNRQTDPAQSYCKHLLSSSQTRLTNHSQPSLPPRNSFHRNRNPTLHLNRQHRVLLPPQRDLTPRPHRTRRMPLRRIFLPGSDRLHKLRVRPRTTLSKGRL